MKILIEVPPGSTLKDVVRDLEKRLISESLDSRGWCKLRAAVALGLSRPGLDKKIRRYGLRAPGKD